MDTANSTTVNLCGTLGDPVVGTWLIAFIAASSKDVRDIPSNSSTVATVAPLSSSTGCMFRMSAGLSAGCCPVADISSVLDASWFLRQSPSSEFASKPGMAPVTVASPICQTLERLRLQ